MKSDSSSEINANESSSEVNEQVANQTNEQGDNNILAAENGNDTANPIELDISVLSELSQQIETLKSQLEDRSTQYMRIAADFENYRKRTAKEKEEIDLQVKRNTITELLPIVDNFERARAHLKPQGEGEMTIHKSYQGVYKQLVDCLKRLGVAPMRPEGQEFDPNLHEAVMREPSDEYPEGTVVEELVRGYYFGERVLRHAMVKVAAPREDISLDSKDLSSQDNS
jgi:molecular chaperone GrpE